MGLRTIGLVAAFALGLLAGPLVTEAQPPEKVRRIGVLTPRSPSDSASWFRAFRQGLYDLGYVEGKNISIEYRYAKGQLNRLPELAAELLRLKVEVVVVQSGWAVRAVQGVSKKIPIVLAVHADPVGAGLVESLARPGGNITGLSEMTPELSGKRLELLKEMVPKLSRVGVLWNPQGGSSTRGWKELQLPARHLGIQLVSLERSPKDFDEAFSDATRAGAGGLIIMPSVVSGKNLERVANLAIKSQLPAIFHATKFVQLGGLASYAPFRSELYRRAATFVDKILKGKNPAELPLEQPAKFDLAINLKTAKVLGMAIPSSILYRATTVIK